MKNLFLIIALFFGSLIYCQTDEPPSNFSTPGAGDSQTNSYLIANLNNLYWLSQHPEYWSKCFLQTHDIYASATSGWDAGSGFKPIGRSSSQPFTGIYNGGGFKIYDLTISRSSSNYIGMFGYTNSNALIKKVGLVSAVISGSNYTGSLVGTAYSTTIRYCYSKGSVSGLDYTGGLVGRLMTSSLMDSSFSTVNIIAGGNRTGGLIGYVYSSTVEKCFSTGNVNTNGYYKGGFIGYNSNSTIRNCYCTGSVICEEFLGYYVGGFIGENDYSTITNCFSIGNVSGSSAVGGFIGMNYSSTVTNCFWDTETSSMGSSSAGTPVNDAGMKNQGTFTGWDFNTTPIWKIDENNNGYPYLSWQVFASPTVQATNITFSSILSYGMTLHWTNGNGEKRVVFVKQGNDGTISPVDNTIYNANPIFGSSESEIPSTGWYCVYNGTGASVTVTGMAQSTEYIVQVFEYSGDGGSTKYLTSIGTNNPNVQQTILLTAPTIQAYNIVFSNVCTNQMTIGWSHGNGEKRSVFMKQANTGIASPVDNTTYPANPVFGSSTTQLGTSGWYCIYNGTGTSVNVTGLALETDYIVQVFEYSGLPGSEMYLTASETTNPKIQATSDYDNYALSFDGINDYVTLPMSLWNTNFSEETAITVEYWFKGTSLSSPYRVQLGGNYFVAGWVNTGNGNIYHIISSDQGVSNGVLIGTSAVINNNQWHHIAMTWQRGGMFTSYVDGIQVAQRAATSDYSLPGFIEYSYLGSYGAGSEFLNGVLDEVRMWNVVRTANDIAAYKDSELNGDEAGLVAYYKMSNGSGSSLSNNAGSSYTGTIPSTPNNPVWVMPGAPVMRYIPTVQAHSIEFSNKTETSMTISWTNGNGAKRVVFLKQASSGSAAPSNNHIYIANSNFNDGEQIGSDGWYCIYNGIGSSVSVTGLNAGNQYIAQVLEYNGAAGAEKYNTATTSGNPSSDSPLPVEIVSFTASAIDIGVELKWITATEVNNYGFEIERLQDCPNGSLWNKTTKLQDWEKIGFVEGSGNSNSPKQYSFVDNNPPSGKLQYRIKQIDTDGQYHYYQTTADIVYNLTDVKEKQIPIKFALIQNYPNPFNPVTIIRYQIPVACQVELIVYDILGNEIAALINEQKQPGYYEVNFNAAMYNLSSGIYFYRLKTEKYTSIKKLILIK